MTEVKVFLFTDLESSTRRWEADPTEMSAALQRHDELVRAALEQHGGEWFKHTGDGVCAAFDSATAAVRAAETIQEALRDDPMLTPRIGIHLGEAEARGDDWFGPALNRCARLMSAAHGGQTVLSGDVASSVHDRASLRDLGQHLLRDLGQPLRVFQLGDGDFPPLRSLSASRSNLPPQRSSFIGREVELERLDAALGADRLVTLVGVGGTGKTRLAMQAAAAAADRFPDGTYLVALAALRDPLHVARAAAEAVGALDPLVGVEARDADEASAAALDRLVSFCATRKVLLVLDNCEHVIDAAAEVADRLLAGGPDVAILATSREALMIEGEGIFPVPALDRAVDLFVDRARAVRPDFELTDGNADLVEAVCKRLDRIPLAIELAAARVRALSVEQIAQRLDDTFRLLTGGARSSRERHQTLAGTLRWSYDLLSPEEQRLFRRLSVFVGGATLEAIEAVCAHDTSADLVLDTVQQLIDKSLLVFDDGGLAVRYRMLEIVHQYATGLLSTSEEATAMRNRHLAWAERLCRPIADVLRVDWEYCVLVEPEHENVAQAFTWAVESDNGAAALSLAISTAMYWRSLGLVSRAHAWLLTALEASEDGDRVQRATAGSFATNFGQLMTGYADTLADFDRWSEEFARIGFPLGIAYNQFGKARALDITGRIEEAAPRYEQAAQLFAQEGDVAGAAWAEFNRAWMDLVRHDRHSALARASAVASANPESVGLEPLLISTALVGMIRMLNGDIDGGRASYQDALDRLGHIALEHAYGCYFAAAVELSVGDAAIGEDYLRASLEGVRSAGAIEQLGGQLAWTATVAHRRGDDAAAAALFLAADRHRQLTAITLAPAGDDTIVATARERVWSGIDAAALSTAEATASAWTFSDATEAALASLVPREHAG